jgi:hypothetical protein
MAFNTATAKNNAVVGYTTPATHAALYSTVPGASAGTELTGGTPAYARKPITWAAAANGVQTATVTFDVKAGDTVLGAGLHTAITGGTYLDGGGVTSQNFATQGTYTLTITATVV